MKTVISPSEREPNALVATSPIAQTLIEAALFKLGVNSAEKRSRVGDANVCYCGFPSLIQDVREAAIMGCVDEAHAREAQLAVLFCYVAE